MAKVLFDGPGPIVMQDLKSLKAIAVGKLVEIYIDVPDADRTKHTLLLRLRPDQARDLSAELGMAVAAAFRNS